ncbi:MAG: leucyl aminopeptidase [Rhodospirillaceae bacterium]|nr:leucyl aminopeptidase [Rhodospirillaceae bacterium]MBT6509272.1 leucyl aminopeptidase [Rhodospirillaceae bacterium]MBT7647274.1 leucyl aminopeptidase [Rhodospirillaceae bacterium]
MNITFVENAPQTADVLVAGVTAEGCVAATTASLEDAAQAVLSRLAQNTRFKGAANDLIEIAAPEGLGAERLCLIGLGDPTTLDSHAWERLGGTLAAACDGTETSLTIAIAPPAGNPSALADFAMGLRLRGYRHDRFRTTPREDDAGAIKTVTVHDPDGSARDTWESNHAHIAAGVVWARDLFAEPANCLWPETFVQEATALEAFGVTLEAHGPDELRAMGAGAMLAVAQGSINEPRLAVLRWNGADDKNEAPLVFVGKGMTFDSGGLSLKPAKGMEEMKGDMAGAAAVTGAMRALAGRKARVNVVGILGLAENMPGANAYRPGDVVKTMAGWTVEVIDTDAEGRMVLADALWFAARKFKPRLMVDLATLTYAIMAGLGLIYTGMYATDDALADELVAASAASGEKLWRMPLDEDYEANLGSEIADLRQIAPDSEFADCAHAAQFLSRFADQRPWAHLDIAGNEMAYDDKPLCPKGPTGVGVRLLDALARDHETVAD